jgi:hypothetical protein
MKPRKLLPALILMALLGGCQATLSAADGADAPPAGRAPLACAAGFADRAGTLKLARTEAPAQTRDSKSAPLRFANSIAVGLPLVRNARITHFDNGWSSLALRIQSGGAKSISVHLTDVFLPRDTEIWLCSSDGLQQQGPYREALDGDVWTPVVRGEEAWLDVLVPTAHQSDFQATLAQVFGGFH